MKTSNYQPSRIARFFTGAVDVTAAALTGVIHGTVTFVDSGVRIVAASAGKIICDVGQSVAQGYHSTRARYAAKRHAKAAEPVIARADESPHMPPPPPSEFGDMAAAGA